MQKVEQCLSDLFYEYETGVRRSTDRVPQELDVTAFAILHLASEYREELLGNKHVLSSADLCETLIQEAYSKQFYPPIWEEAEKLPFALVRSLIAEPGIEQENGAAFLYYLLSYHQSGVRYHTFFSSWFYKKHISIELACPHLFKNIADTLGYVEHAIGLARAPFDSDEAFFSAANASQPLDFEDQYRDRLDQCKQEGRLKSYMNLYLAKEAEVLKKIQKIFFGKRYVTQV